VPVQSMIGLAFVLMAGSLAAVFVGVALEARTESWERVHVRADLIRRWWFVGLAFLATIVFAVSMTWLPYQAVRAAQLPGPATAVQVTAKQFDFALSSKCLPADHPVEFSVASADVNHGFAIYDAAGRIVGQTQAMPGYTNVLLLSLPGPGTYTVHCDELCGPGHPYMQASFEVGSCASAGGGCNSGCS
jgi:cytochrome c oxidase subunit II